MAASPPHQHHGFLLKQMLDHVEAQEAEIAALDERIEAALAPFAAQVELLATIPGVALHQVILAEIGPDIRAPDIVRAKPAALTV